MKRIGKQLIALTALTLGSLPLHAAADWRLEFLQAEKQKTDTDSLKNSIRRINHRPRS